MTNIEVVSGNVVDALLAGDVDFLINQVNCKGVYGAGIAKEISEKIPDTRQHYLDACHYAWKNNIDLMGNVAIHSGVIHLFGQDGYGRSGRYTNYGALSAALSKVADAIKEDAVGYIDVVDLVIGVPYRIGCGLGGGDWEVVKELIEYQLGWAKKVVVFKLENEQ